MFFIQGKFAMASWKTIVIHMPHLHTLRLQGRCAGCVVFNLEDFDILPVLKSLKLVSVDERFEHLLWVRLNDCLEMWYYRETPIEELRLSICRWSDPGDIARALEFVAELKWGGNGARRTEAQWKVLKEQRKAMRQYCMWFVQNRHTDIEALAFLSTEKHSWFSL